MVLYYAITSVLMFVNLAVFILRDDDKKTSYYIKFILFIMTLANLGYLALSTSRSLEAMMLANKITYLGGCFMPPIMFCCMLALCNFKMNRFVKGAMYAYSVFVYVLVLQTGYSNFYYKGSVVGKFYDAYTMTNVHGVGYVFFFIILYGYIIANLVVIAYAFIKKRVSKRTLLFLTLMQVTTIGAFLIGRAINPYFEVMPAVYVFDGFIFLLLHAQISQYSVKDIIYSSMEQENLTGYLLFDEKRRFVGSNDLAIQLIPGLDKCKIDAVLSVPEVEFIYNWLDDFIRMGTVSATYEYSKRFYEVHIKIVTDSDKKKGYLIELQDYTERQKYVDLLASYNRELQNKVDDQTKHIIDIQRKVILGMANMVENRDNNTGGHIRRTSEVIRILIDVINENQFFDLSESFCEDLIKAAPMHDLGKIAIDDDILRKPGRFTTEEYEVMKTHAAKSAEICENILRGVEEEHFVNVAVNVAHYHHEKWNGQGYPKKLQGEEIPLEARIMAIADVYDALVSKRCYKDAMNFEQAYDIMIDSMGSHFDPAMEKVFVAARDRLERYYLQQ